MRSLRPAPLLLSLAAVLAACATSQTPPAPAPEAQVAPGKQVMVTLRPAPQPLVERTVRELALTYGLRPVTAWQMESLDAPCVVFEVAQPRLLPRALSQLAGDHRVAVAELIQRFRVEAAPAGDPYRHLQTHADALHLDAAHALATGRDVKVAVVDTGVDFDHPDLRGRVAVARSFVRQEPQTFTSDVHGTAVAGVIAATAGNGEGIVGVAPESALMALKACWQEGGDATAAVCDSYTLAQAIDFAVAHDARVLNLSLAGPEDAILAALLANALDRGVVVIAAEAAAGAAAGSGGGGVGFPASLERVVGVRAVEREGASASLGAPGAEILTTFPRGAYDFLSGPSLAAAQVSGVAALLLERRPELDAAGVEQLLRQTAGDNPGSRVVNACAALRAALGVDAPC